MDDKNCYGLCTKCINARHLIWANICIRKTLISLKYFMCVKRTQNFNCISNSWYMVDLLNELMHLNTNLNKNDHDLFGITGMMWNCNGQYPVISSKILLNPNDLHSECLKLKKWQGKHLDLICIILNSICYFSSGKCLKTWGRARVCLGFDPCNH